MIAGMRAIWQAPLHYRALQRMINSVVPIDQPLPVRGSKFQHRPKPNHGGIILVDLTGPEPHDDSFSPTQI